MTQCHPDLEASARISARSARRGITELTRKEDENVTWWALHVDLEYGLESGLLVVGLCLLGVENLDLELAALDVDDGSSGVEARDQWSLQKGQRADSRVEKITEALSVDSRTHHDDLER